VVQPTQLVIETLRFEDFGLRFDRVRGLLLLGFDKGRAELPLSLPLLDYIRRRDAGELGNALSPIHQAQLDCFRAKLLRVTAETRHSDDEIALLRSGIDGGVHLHRFFLDRDQRILEQN
jgi:IS5 family transposase